MQVQGRNSHGDKDRENTDTGDSSLDENRDGIIAGAVAVPVETVSKDPL